MAKVWRFGKDINTDLITPGRFNMSADSEYLKKCCFIEVRPEFVEKVQKGDFIVAEENFGCGSSRETAPVAIKASGIKAVIAKSFARIFYRNAINIGLPVLESREAVDSIQEGHEIQVDFENGKILNKTTGQEFQATKLPKFVVQIFDEGGVIQYLNKFGKFQI
ncbi:MAG: 3-isopropylmalate dehydratase small subunit [Candidatus Diapherotrites archaeon]|nr:3-isopropylmalate dehydratase small subunit [Candidatus Diapherotrites archaeon]